MEISKKVWPEYFQMIIDGKKKFEFRLADFELKEGDTLILKEWNPETKEYTGREIKKECKSVMKFNPLKFNHTEEEIKEHGFYVIELGG